MTEISQAAAAAVLACPTALVVVAAGHAADTV